jgi:predicted negative regulator of RcsB-dependent stress response
MNPEKRMTRHRMKEDRLVSTTFKATEYIQKNQMPFIVGAIVIVVIFAAVLFFRWSGDRKRNESSALLSRAEMIGAMGQMEQYTATLTMLADDYTGSTAAKIATLRLANDYFDKKQYDQAIKYFTLLSDKYSSDKLVAASSAAGLGACMEMKGNFLEAGKDYQKAADYKSGDLWTSEFLLKAGQNFAKGGDKKSAEAAYNEIIEKYANSNEITVARRSLAEIQN